MKIIYKNSLDRHLHELINEKHVCSKCGCVFMIEKIKELKMEEREVDPRENPRP